MNLRTLFLVALLLATGYVPMNAQAARPSSRAGVDRALAVPAPPLFGRQAMPSFREERGTVLPAAISDSAWLMIKDIARAWTDTGWRTSYIDTFVYTRLAANIRTSVSQS